MPMSTIVAKLPPANVSHAQSNPINRTDLHIGSSKPTAPASTDLVTRNPQNAGTGAGTGARG
jgi:hypothetical protein